MFEHNVFNPCIITDNGVLDNGIGNNGLFTYCCIWADYGMFKNGGFGYEYRVINNTSVIFFFASVLFKKNFIGGEESFRFAAVIPAVNWKRSECFPSVYH